MSTFLTLIVRLTLMLALGFSGCSTWRPPRHVFLERKFDADEAHFIKNRRNREGPWRHPRPEDIPAFGTVEARHKAFLALYDAYFPWTQIDRHEGLLDQGRAIREELWEKVRENQEYQALLTLFSNILLFDSPLLPVLLNSYLPLEHRRFKFSADELRPFEYYLEGARSSKHTPGVWSLITSDRERIIKLMLLSPHPVMRRLGRKIDDLFLNAIYGSDFVRNIFSIGRYVKLKPETDSEKNPKVLGRKKLRVLPKIIDVVVVGAGPAGVVMAHHFYNLGMSVALIEKGPLLEMNQPEFSYQKQGLQLIQGSGIDQGQVQGHTAQVFGGGSWVGGSFGQDWLSVASQLETYPWKPEKKIDELEEEIANEQSKAALQWAQFHFPMRLFRGLDGNTVELILKEGATKSRLELIVPPALRYDGTGGPLTESNKLTVVETLIKEMQDNDMNEDKKRFFPISDAEVLKVEWLPAPRLAQATGIELRLKEESATRILRSRNIILSAGAHGTPAILHRSSLAQLTKTKMGKGFAAWPEVRMMAIMKRPVMKSIFTPWQRKSGIARIKLKASQDKSPVFLEWRPLSVLDVALLGGGDKIQKFQRVLQYEKMATFVVRTFDPPDESRALNLEDGSWTYRPRPETLKLLEDGLYESSRLLLEAGAKEIIWDIHIPILGTKMTEYKTIRSKKDLELVTKDIMSQALWAPIYTQNVSGTLGSGVLEKDFRVRGMRNLYVVDSSVAPYDNSPDMIAPMILLSKYVAHQIEKKVKDR